MTDPTPTPAPASSDPMTGAEAGGATESAAVEPTAMHAGRAVPWPPTPTQRGLAAPYPPGGADPDPDAGHREERFYLRLLIAMVLVIVVGGFTIGLIGLFLGFAGGAE